MSITVGVKDREEGWRYWGATLINIVLQEGEWKAVVRDNFYETITVVPASDLREWEM